MRTGELRAFVALEMPAKIRENLWALARQSLIGMRDFRIVHPDNLHITLQFLGNTDWSRVPLVIRSLREAVMGFRVFHLEVGEPGVFPPRGQPRILYVGVGKGETELALLASKVRKATTSQGFFEDKPFSPHITLARHKRSYGRGQLQDTAAIWRSSMEERLLQTGTSQMNWKVDSVLLMESRLRSDGPVYTVVNKIKIEG